MTSGTALFRQARDTLIEHRMDYERAVAAFSWPRLQQFNWALDWFDVIARDNQRPALRIVGDSGRDVSLSFEDLRQR
jgi:acetyl-CoA synthetase